MSHYYIYILRTLVIVKLKKIKNVEDYNPIHPTPTPRTHTPPPEQEY
jgi:hypothetical protein